MRGLRYQKDNSNGWGLAVLLAVLWGILPLVPALSQGQIPGSPFTDLYPSVWGLDWFASQYGFPLHNLRISAPEGTPFYFSSPLHGWAAIPLRALFGPVLAYSLTLIAARMATVLVSFGAFKALGLGPKGALMAAGIYGASPFFHGYAVEGIIEGSDGWALALWVWMVAARRVGAASVAMALCIASSWYLGMVACFFSVFWGITERKAWISLGVGLLLASPFLYGFLSTMTGASPLAPEIRAAMGSHLQLQLPGIMPGNNPFAITSYLGLSTLALVVVGLRDRPVWALGALICWVLSFGVGPWYWLPVLRSIRFPYRWHAGTLFCMAVVAGTVMDRLRWQWLAWIPPLEGLLFSPIEPIVPSAAADVPALYNSVQGPLLLEVPGPLAMPPGTINRSRPRARYLLYAQTLHAAASPWHFDFNGVSEGTEAEWLAQFRACDPLYQRIQPKAVCGALTLGALRQAGVTQVMVHRDELGANADYFEDALVTAGAVKQGEEGDIVLYQIPRE